MSDFKNSLPDYSNNQITNYKSIKCNSKDISLFEQRFPALDLKLNYIYGL